jgi:AraC family transcriptional regulator
MNNTNNQLLQSNKKLVLSSRDLGWNGILLEQYQTGLTPSEVDSPAQSDHFLRFYLGQPARLTHKYDGRVYAETIYKGNTSFVPAGQPSYWRCHGSDNHKPVLHIYLPPESIGHIAETSELNLDRIELNHSFSRYNQHFAQTAMMLLAELKSGSILGEIYTESLIQVLVIHLLRNYSNLTQPIPAHHSSLSQVRSRSAIDYIHAHLDLNLSLVQIAKSINISPSYFASSFKQEIGISLHQYVIRQRVERAQMLLMNTDLPIVNIALQVGFSSQSHLTWHCKRLTGMTPKQISQTSRI